jgi:hypothetical protein
VRRELAPAREHSRPDAQQATQALLDEPLEVEERPRADQVVFLLGDEGLGVVSEPEPPQLAARRRVFCV